jgi:hypothetical protein
MHTHRARTEAHCNASSPVSLTSSNRVDSGRVSLRAKVVGRAKRRTRQYVVGDLPDIAIDDSVGDVGAIASSHTSVSRVATNRHVSSKKSE